GPFLRPPQRNSVAVFGDQHVDLLADRVVQIGCALHGGFHQEFAEGLRVGECLWAQAINGPEKQLLDIFRDFHGFDSFSSISGQDGEIMTPGAKRQFQLFHSEASGEWVAMGISSMRIGHLHYNQRTGSRRADRTPGRWFPHSSSTLLWA